MIDQVVFLSTGDLAARYEELRGRAVGELPRGRPDAGWTALICRGMSAWMKACSSGSPRADERPRGEASSQGLRGEMVLVLAGMALGRSKGVSA